jgi:hypothetical protein
MARTRIAVIGSDLDTLSRIYLGLTQRNYRVETSTQLPDRDWLRKFRPDVLIMSKADYDVIGAQQKKPVIVYLEAGAVKFDHPGDVFVLRKPVAMEELLALLEKIVY